MQWVAILLLCILASVSYGILHDQITARICVEYFTIGHPRIIQSEDPTRLGIAWGFVATWWVGVMLGTPLATMAQLGSLPKRSARSLIVPLAILISCTAGLATVAGLVAYVAATNDWIVLTEPMSKMVPRDKHAFFLADLWTHRASYTGGFVGGIVLMVGVIRWRWRMSIDAANRSTSPIQTPIISRT